MVMRIYCDFCRQTWDVYSHDDPMRPSARRCPHCGAAEIDEGTWMQMISGMRHADAVNMSLSDYASEYHRTFAVSYLADSPFQCAGKFTKG